jgi:hypothetical protein
MEQIFYGFYEDPSSDRPDHEPQRDAPCLYCGKPVQPEDVRTHSLMYSSESYAKRSYFYRTHRTCDERYGPAHELPAGTDHMILDMIARNGD